MFVVILFKFCIEFVYTNKHEWMNKHSESVNLRQDAVVNSVERHISYQNYFCRMAKFGKDVLSHSWVITSGGFSAQQFDLELWPWPIKSYQCYSVQLLNIVFSSWKLDSYFPRNQSQRTQGTKELTYLAIEPTNKPKNTPYIVIPWNHCKMQIRNFLSCRNHVKYKKYFRLWPI